MAPYSSTERKSEIEHDVRQLQLAEAETIEHLLELVGERRHAVGAKQAGQPLERVHRAEHVVDEPGIDLPRAQPLVDRQQIAPQAPLDDLLRLGEELLARPISSLHG